MGSVDNIPDTLGRTEVAARSLKSNTAGASSVADAVAPSVVKKRLRLAFMGGVSCREKLCLEGPEILRTKRQRRLPVRGVYTHGVASGKNSKTVLAFRWRNIAISLIDWVLPWFRSPVVS